MFSEPEETPDHPVEMSGQGERDTQRQRERELCDSRPLKGHILPSSALAVPWKVKQTLNCRCYCPTHQLPLLPLSCSSAVWPGLRARLYLVVGGMQDYMQLQNNHASCALDVYVRQVIKMCTPSPGTSIGR